MQAHTKFELMSMPTDALLALAFDQRAEDAVAVELALRLEAAENDRQRLRDNNIALLGQVVVGEMPTGLCGGSRPC